MALRAQIVRLYLVFTYIWREDFAKIPKVSGVRAMSTAQSNTMVSIGVTIYRANFQLQFTSTSPIFTRQNALKKLLRKELIEQIIRI